ncbi:MAG: ATP-dependent Clp protease ATP-binding subunit, partial [Clostridiales bacterium]|nr:ATP-dependent Clp protease ATP-binding subunit [Clostridiales bacterium]
LKRTFRPEILNRIDDIIVFHQLSKDDIKEIARRMLESLKSHTNELEIDMIFTDGAVEKIADAGFDAVYGARPLRRAIQAQIEDKLSEGILDSAIKAGKSYVCDYRDGGFVFEEKREAVADADAKAPEEADNNNDAF